MTREDIDNIISIICPNDEDFEKPIISPAYLKKELETLALELEPCEDCISKKDIKKYLSAPNEEGDRVIYEDDLDLLPPVQPKPKTGHWIEVIDEIDSLGNKTWHHKCSICGNENSGWGDFKYCPNCGAKMESEG